MNLVEKLAQELGLSKELFSSRTRPYGSGKAECVEKGWKFILGLGSRINSPSLFFSVSRQELSGVLRTTIVFLFFFLPLFFLSPSFVRSLLLYTLLLYSSWLSICWSCRSLLECLSHPAPSSTCCELQQIRWHCLGVIPSLMRLDCQLRAFNVEMTASPIIAPPPYPRSCPPMLVLLFGTTGRAALEIVLLFPFMTPVRRGRDGPRRCLPAALGLPYSSLDVFLSSAWALGLIINGPESPDLRIIFKIIWIIINRLYHLYKLVYFLVKYTLNKF